MLHISTPIHHKGTNNAVQLIMKYYELPFSSPKFMEQLRHVSLVYFDV